MESKHSMKTFVRCKPFNVALIGDSKVGKSTFISLLQTEISSDFVEDPYRGTVLPEVKSLYYYDETDQTNVLLNILDTPGLDEVPAEGLARPNEELQDIISTHIKDNFSSINLILITVQKKGITDNIIRTIYSIKEYFGNKYLNNMCLLITHCEDLKKDGEIDYLEKLKINENMWAFCDAIKGRVLFTGKNSGDSTKKDLDFLVEQTRRRNDFLLFLKKSNPIHLKNSTNINDIRPIDILESASVTNSIIINMPKTISRDYDQLKDELLKLSKLELNKEDNELRNEIIEQLGDFIKELKLEPSTEEEIRDARHYDEVDIPLKRKAEKLKRDHYVIKSQLNSLIDISNQFGLHSIVVTNKPNDLPTSPKVVVKGLRGMRDKKEEKLIEINDKKSKDCTTI